MSLKNDISAYLDYYKPAEENQKEPKLFELILVLSVITLCIANVFAQKVITVFGHNIALSGLIFPFTFLFLILINETYGHQKCGRSIIAMLIGQFIFLFGLWQFSLLSTPELTQNAVIVTKNLRLAFSNFNNVIIGSMLAVGFSFYFFSILNSWLKVKLCKLNPVIRFLVSVGLAKWILVIVAYSFNLWGVVTIKQLVFICINTWIVKMFIAVFIITISVPLVNKLKKMDREDTYDIHISYSPFRLYSDKSKGVNLFDTIKNSEI